jgi:catalase-peroxidase
MGLGWISTAWVTGNGVTTPSAQRPRRRLDTHSHQLGHVLPGDLFKYDWQLTKSPSGGQQWIPTDPEARELVPDAFDPG